jgi:hypothetical protein
MDKTDRQFCRVFVHFRYWPDTPDIMAIRDRLLAGETIKVVYDNPWFWKCSASRVAKPDNTHPKTAPYISLNTIDNPNPVSITDKKGEDKKGEDKKDEDTKDEDTKDEDTKDEDTKDEEIKDGETESSV